jgi:hypothetical protein
MSAQWQREAISPYKVSVELQATLTRIPRVPRCSTGNYCSADVAENEPTRAINPWIALVPFAHASLHAKTTGCK